MTRYWIKIGLSALLIFGVGYTFFAVGRSVVSKVKSDEAITIPLGSFIPFRLAGDQLGTIRSITFHRSAPGTLSGFGLRARLNDSAAFDRVKDCRLSVNDPAHLDERTSFLCLQSDSGYEAFGEVRLELRVGEDTRSVIQPLLLPTEVVQEIRNKQAAPAVGSSFGDSLASEIRARVRVQSRARSDSIRAASLEERARRMQQQADSLKARSKAPPPTP